MRRGTPSLLFVGSGLHDEAVRSSLACALGERASWLPALPAVGRCPAADLVVGVHAIGDHEGRSAFAAWSQVARARALAVAFGPRATLVGPLIEPGRVGCGHCALQRMSAASAAAGAAGRTETDNPDHPEVVHAWASTLVREVDRILREGPEASRLLDHILRVDVRGSGVSLHRVIPLSHCPVCGGAATLTPATHTVLHSIRADTVEELLGALAGWVDPLTGLVPDLFVDHRDDAGPELAYVVTAAPPHVMKQDGSRRRLPLGWGKGWNLSSAIFSAVGEAIERYAASLPDPTRIVWERADDLPGRILDPRTLELYADEQYARNGFPYCRFDPAVRHPWVLGRWLGSNAPVWVPAVFAFLSLELGREHLFCQGTSNGLAASTDFDDAALRAVLELIERDAFVGAWMTGRPGQRIAIDDSLDSPLRQVLHGIESLGGTVEIYVLPTSACGTTACCLALGDGARWPGAVIGLGADLDPHRAVSQAVLELAQTGPHLRRLMRSAMLKAPAEPRGVQEMLHHAAYYFPRERAAAFDFLRTGNARPGSVLTGGNRERSLAACTAALAAAGIRVALVDVTSPDVATGPFRVVRAVSPDLQPISYGYGLERMPVSRVRDAGLARERAEIHPIW